MKLSIIAYYLKTLMIMAAGSPVLSAQSSGEPSLLPLPKVIKWSEDKFRFQHENLFSDPRVRKVTLPFLENVPLNMDEAYRLVVNNDSILIYATGDEGFFRAASTIKQLRMTDHAGQYLAGCQITDWPAFRIRGFMHDCGRSFIPLEELKREIDLLSGFKINTFHWHLTEDIAWRLASDIIPQLTSAEVARRDKNNYYSKEEVADFVRYCNDHFIEVIPEIDMPGHSDAFTRAVGFGMQSEEGKKIVRQLLDEACRLFSGHFFHIGTDEVNIANPDFIREMTALVRSHGKEVIGWLPGGNMDEGAIRQLWADVDLPVNTKVIDSRYRYLNHTDFYSDLFSIYNSRLCDSQFGSDMLAGGICCIWNDRKPASVEDILISNAFYPMMLAFAERSWAGGGDNIKERGVRMGLPGDPAFERFRDFESRMMAVRERFLKEVPFPYNRQTGIFWRISPQYPNFGDLDYSVSYERDLINNPGSNSSSEVSYMPAAGATVYLRHTWGEKVPAYYSDPKPDHTAYAYTWIYSPYDMVAGLHFSTHNYGRSELDQAPPEGEWDHKRSRIWLNGELILPPSWINQGVKPDYETPYANENMWSRPPVHINLKKGWNSLVIKLPVGKFSTSETRLVKWMYTAMIVTPDGKSQPEGLVYSPEKLSPHRQKKDSFARNSVEYGTGLSGEEFRDVLSLQPEMFPDIRPSDRERPGKKEKTEGSAIIENYNELQLPEAWSDNMVLQRERPIYLCGNSNSNETIKVSIAGKSYFSKASSTGEWEVVLEPLKSGGPYELNVSTPSDTIIVRNILAGEVWFCSGQSNMEWPLNRSDGWDEIQESISDPYLRIINFRRKPLNWDEPWDSLTLEEINNLDFFQDANWSAATSESACDFSAVAYYFGRKLREELGVPVGLIAMAVGGSPAEAWIERKALESHPQLIGLLNDYRKGEYQEKWVSDVISKNLEKTNNQKQRHPFEPSYLYESGISKIAGFPIKGFIWYQGESNAGFPELYKVMLPVLVQSWRASWRDNTLPFYFAQLSSLNRPSWPEFRDTQRKLADIIPQSGMIVTTDAGHPTDVHPRDKRTVGERFASLALRKSYGKKWYSISPEIYKATYNGRKIIISFKNTSKLLTSDGLPVREVEISGTDNVFIPADVRLSRNRIIIYSDEAKYVRYGWKPFSEGNLIGESGLPVSTFRLKIEK